MAKKQADAGTSYRPPTTGLGGYPLRFHSVSWGYCARLYGDAWYRVANRRNHPQGNAQAEYDADYLRWHGAMMRLCRHALKTLNGEN